MFVSLETYGMTKLTREQIVTLSAAIARDVAAGKVGVAPCSKKHVDRLNALRRAHGISQSSASYFPSRACALPKR